jgi:hypothetical protein
MFNRLEEIGTTDMPETPILGFKITAALQPRHFLLGQNHVSRAHPGPATSDEGREALVSLSAAV